MKRRKYTPKGDKRKGKKCNTIENMALDGMNMDGLYTFRSRLPGTHHDDKAMHNHVPFDTFSACTSAEHVRFFVQQFVIAHVRTIGQSKSVKSPVWTVGMPLPIVWVARRGDASTISAGSPFAVWCIKVAEWAMTGLDRMCTDVRRKQSAAEKKRLAFDRFEYVMTRKMVWSAAVLVDVLCGVLSALHGVGYVSAGAQGFVAQGEKGLCLEGGGSMSVAETVWSAEHASGAQVAKDEEATAAPPFVWRRPWLWTQSAWDAVAQGGTWVVNQPHAGERVNGYGTRQEACDVMEEAVSGDGEVVPGRETASDGMQVAERWGGEAAMGLWQDLLRVVVAPSRCLRVIEWLLSVVEMVAGRCEHDKNSAEMDALHQSCVALAHALPTFMHYCREYLVMGRQDLAALAIIRRGTNAGANTDGSTDGSEVPLTPHHESPLKCHPLFQLTSSDATVSEMTGMAPRTLFDTCVKILSVGTAATVAIMHLTGNSIPSLAVDDAGTVVRGHTVASGAYALLTLCGTGMLQARCVVNRRKTQDARSGVQGAVPVDVVLEGLCDALDLESLLRLAEVEDGGASGASSQLLGRFLYSCMFGGLDWFSLTGLLCPGGSSVNSGNEGRKTISFQWNDTVTGVASLKESFVKARQSISTQFRRCAAAFPRTDGVGYEAWMLRFLATAKDEDENVECVHIHGYDVQPRRMPHVTMVVPRVAGQSGHASSNKPKTMSLVTAGDFVAIQQYEKDGDGRLVKSMRRLMLEKVVKAVDGDSGRLGRLLAMLWRCYIVMRSSPCVKTQDVVPIASRTVRETYVGKSVLATHGVTFTSASGRFDIGCVLGIDSDVERFSCKYGSAAEIAADFEFWWMLVSCIPAIRPDAFHERADCVLSKGEIARLAGVVRLVEDLGAARTFSSVVPLPIHLIPRSAEDQRRLQVAVAGGKKKLGKRQQGKDSGSHAWALHDTRTALRLVQSFHAFLMQSLMRYMTASAWFVVKTAVTEPQKLRELGDTAALHAGAVAELVTAIAEQDSRLAFHFLPLFWVCTFVRLICGGGKPVPGASDDALACLVRLKTVYARVREVEGLVASALFAARMMAIGACSQVDHTEVLDLRGSSGIQLGQGIIHLLRDALAELVPQRMLPMWVSASNFVSPVDMHRLRSTSSQRVMEAVVTSLVFPEAVPSVLRFQDLVDMVDEVKSGYGARGAMSDDKRVVRACFASLLEKCQSFGLALVPCVPLCGHLLEHDSDGAQEGRVTQSTTEGHDGQSRPEIVVASTTSRHGAPSVTASVLCDARLLTDVDDVGVTWFHPSVLSANKLGRRIHDVVNCVLALVQETVEAYNDMSTVDSSSAHSRTVMVSHHDVGERHIEAALAGGGSSQKKHVNALETAVSGLDMETFQQMPMFSVFPGFLLLCRVSRPPCSVASSGMHAGALQVWENSIMCGVWYDLLVSLVTAANIGFAMADEFSGACVTLFNRASAPSIFGPFGSEHGNVPQYLAKIPLVISSLKLAYAVNRVYKSCALFTVHAKKSVTDVQNESLLTCDGVREYLALPGRRDGYRQHSLSLFFGVMSASRWICSHVESMAMSQYLGDAANQFSNSNASASGWIVQCVDVLGCAVDWVAHDIDGIMIVTCQSDVTSLPLPSTDEESATQSLTEAISACRKISQDVNATEHESTLLSVIVSVVWDYLSFVADSVDFCSKLMCAIVGGIKKNSLVGDGDRVALFGAVVKHLATCLHAVPRFFQTVVDCADQLIREKAGEHVAGCVVGLVHRIVTVCARHVLSPVPAALVSSGLALPADCSTALLDHFKQGGRLVDTLCLERNATVIVEYLCEGYQSKASSQGVKGSVKNAVLFASRVLQYASSDLSGYPTTSTYGIGISVLLRLLSVAVTADREGESDVLSNAVALCRTMWSAGRVVWKAWSKEVDECHCGDVAKNVSKMVQDVMTVHDGDGGDLLRLRMMFGLELVQFLLVMTLRTKDSNLNDTCVKKGVSRLAKGLVCMINVDAMLIVDARQAMLSVLSAVVRLHMSCVSRSGTIFDMLTDIAGQKSQHPDEWLYVCKMVVASGAGSGTSSHGQRGARAGRNGTGCQHIAEQVKKLLCLLSQARVYCRADDSNGWKPLGEALMMSPECIICVPDLWLLGSTYTDAWSPVFSILRTTDGDNVLWPAMLSGILRHDVFEPLMLPEWQSFRDVLSDLPLSVVLGRHISDGEHQKAWPIVEQDTANTVHSGSKILIDEMQRQVVRIEAFAQRAQTAVATRDIVTLFRMEVASVMPYVRWSIMLLGAGGSLPQRVAVGRMLARELYLMWIRLCCAARYVVQAPVWEAAEGMLGPVRSPFHLLTIVDSFDRQWALNTKGNDVMDALCKSGSVLLSVAIWACESSGDPDAFCDLMTLCTDAFYAISDASYVTSRSRSAQYDHECMDVVCLCNAIQFLVRGPCVWTGINVHGVIWGRLSALVDSVVSVASLVNSRSASSTGIVASKTAIEMRWLMSVIAVCMQASAQHVVHVNVRSVCQMVVRSCQTVSAAYCNEYLELMYEDATRAPDHVLVLSRFLEALLVPAILTVRGLSSFLSRRSEAEGRAGAGSTTCEYRVTVETTLASLMSIMACTVLPLLVLNEWIGGQMIRDASSRQDNVSHAFLQCCGALRWALEDVGTLQSAWWPTQVSVWIEQWCLSVRSPQVRRGPHSRSFAAACIQFMSKYKGAFTLAPEDGGRVGSRQVQRQTVAWDACLLDRVPNRSRRAWIAVMSKLVGVHFSPMSVSAVRAMTEAFEPIGKDERHYGTSVFRLFV